MIARSAAVALTVLAFALVPFDAPLSISSPKP
jgi:hypothetical protein